MGWAPGGGGINLTAIIRCANYDVQRRVEGAKSYGAFGINKRGVYLTIGWVGKRSRIGNREGEGKRPSLGDHGWLNVLEVQMGQRNSLRNTSKQQWPGNYTYINEPLKKTSNLWGQKR